MPGLGFGELLLIMLVALVVFGPRRLPEIGRMIGKALAEFRKASDELKNTIEREVRVDDLKQTFPSTIAPPLQAVSRIEPSALSAGETIDATPVEATDLTTAEGHDGHHETVARLEPAAAQGAAAEEAAASHESPVVHEGTASAPTTPQAE